MFFLPTLRCTYVKASPHTSRQPDGHQGRRAPPAAVSTVPSSPVPALPAGGTAWASPGVHGGCAKTGVRASRVWTRVQTRACERPARGRVCKRGRVSVLRVDACANAGVRASRVWTRVQRQTVPASRVWTRVHHTHSSSVHTFNPNRAAVFKTSVENSRASS